jgi:hypothetical protein
MLEDNLIAEAYPGARSVIVFFEGPRMELLWQVVRNLAAGGVPVASLMEVMRSSADETLDFGPPGLLTRENRPQMDHSDFLTYMKAKIGAM